MTWTERHVLDLLRQRHAAKNGNGPEHAYLEHVRDAAGFAAKRTADALAMHLWQSRGLELSGFEVKVSRSDWRRELADPDKADGWCAVVDRWWIAAPAGVVPVDELPSPWGLMEAHGEPADPPTRLKVRKQAPLLRPSEDRPPITRSMLAPLLRAAGAGLVHTPDKVAEEAAFNRGVEVGLERQQYSSKDWQRAYEQQKERVEESDRIQREIQTALGGVAFHEWRAREGPDRVRHVADALRSVLASDAAVEAARRTLDQQATELEQQAKWLRQRASRGTAP